MTTNLTTKTAATYRITRSEHGAQVAEEARRLYVEHTEGPLHRQLQDAHPAVFRDAAERIISLEEAVRARDEEIVDLHAELRLLRQECDGHSADARYWETCYRNTERES